jgi:hypothetical protein
MGQSHAIWQPQQPIISLSIIYENPHHQKMKRISIITPLLRSELLLNTAGRVATLVHFMLQSDEPVCVYTWHQQKSIRPDKGFEDSSRVGKKKKVNDMCLV